MTFAHQVAEALGYEDLTPDTLTVADLLLQASKGDEAEALVFAGCMLPSAEFVADLGLDEEDVQNWRDECVDKLIRRFPAPVAV